MLQSPEFSEQLDTYHSKDYFNKQVLRVIELPKPLREIGLALISAEKKGQPLSHQERDERLRSALNNLAELSQKDRQRLFTALAPKISAEIEAAWQVFDRLPYTEFYNRRPFRLSSASSPAVRNSVRCQWVHRLVQVIRGYEQPAPWFAAWAPYLGYGAPDTLGRLFAGAIDRGGSSGQEVYDILTASARGDHPIGKMGRHVVRGLLCATRPDGWALIERLLLAAQREEGLRQVILEAVDEANPEIFSRLLRLIIDENLIRFSAVVRAVTVWVGLPFEAADPKTVKGVLVKLQQYIDQPDAKQSTLTDGLPQDQYLALWSIAYFDAQKAVAAANPLLEDPLAERRFTAVYFLNQTQLGECQKILLPLLDDPDLRVAIYAYSGIFSSRKIEDWFPRSDLFERVERLIRRIPARTKTLKPIVWEWMAIQLIPSHYPDILIKILGERSPTRLLPYLKDMSPHFRLEAAKLFLDRVDEDPRYRNILFDMAGDRDSYVHEKIFSLLETITPRVEEIHQLEALLTRKTNSLRRCVVGLLLRQPDADLLASIERLLNQKDEQQHLAGVELLLQMAQANREREECRAIAARLQNGGLSEVERHILADLFDDQPITYSLEDALGLADLNNLSKPIEPHTKNELFGLVKNIRLGSPAAAACIKALEDLVDEHRTDPIEVNDWQNETRTELLGNIVRGWINPDPNLSKEENLQRFPLAGVLEKWWQERLNSQKDADGFEIIRAQAALTLFSSHYTPTGKSTLKVPDDLYIFLDQPYDLTLQYLSAVTFLLGWLAYLHPAANAASFLLAAVEETCCRIKNLPIPKGPGGVQEFWIINSSWLGYINLARQQRRFHGDEWTRDDHARFWGLIIGLEQYLRSKNSRYQPEILDALYAYQAGAASEDDVFFLLVGLPKFDTSLRPDHSFPNKSFFSSLHQLSGKRPNPLFAEFPFLRGIVDRCRDRILDIELRRGDLPTAASIPALTLRSVRGTANVIRLLSAMGDLDFVRNSTYYDQDRSTVLSYLIRVCYPLDSDTPEIFTELVRQAKISDDRLVELAVFAPQWSPFVEKSLGWQGMTEAVWWVYAHTKDRQWSIDIEIRESWAAQIGEYTPLTADELLDGAVDVAWFYRAYSGLGEERWQKIYRAARYSSGGTGHTRARLFADAMLGKSEAGELIERAKTKRNQDAVRAVGLIPLPLDQTRQTEMLRRYEMMQEFLRTSKKFGSQRQANEKLAVTIGMENLARTAGYTDPQRLEWAMELESVTDLAAGPVLVQAGDLCLELSIDDLGESELSVRRGGKILKNIPPAARKDPAVSALVDRKKALERQTSRMRVSLENAMIRGDCFSAGEIQNLLRHPILRVMLEQLVFIGPEGMGYITRKGQALESLDRDIPLGVEDRLRIAHPFDLLESGCWHDWQHECFIHERIQPFKQVFRELYCLTRTEQDEKSSSSRYAGHQVNPRQALALFRNRGWVFSPEEGVYKTFHGEGVVARVNFAQGFFTPAEVEGLTFDSVGFTHRSDWLSISLDEIPPRMFSEVMRDLDLVVSVAYSGGVDPEASASTVESRAALVQETCVLLKLTNVKVENHHALVAGKLGNYTIHLGSGTVHKQPGGALCIIPVHAQHRGRLFIPFVDNDPKTAEVVSKVLLLAKDQEIKDPTIIEQLIR